MPSLMWPYVLRAEIANPPGNTAPGSATTTRSPAREVVGTADDAARLGALGDPNLAPPDRLAVRLRLVVERHDLANDERAGHRALDLDRVDLEPGAHKPLGHLVAAFCRPGSATSSRSHDSPTRTSGLRAERECETHVALDDVTHVAAAVA